MWVPTVQARQGGREQRAGVRVGRTQQSGGSPPGPFLSNPPLCSLFVCCPLYFYFLSLFQLVVFSFRLQYFRVRGNILTSKSYEVKNEFQIKKLFVFTGAHPPDSAPYMDVWIKRKESDKRNDLTFSKVRNKKVSLGRRCICLKQMLYSFHKDYKPHKCLNMTVNSYCFQPIL